LNNICSTALCSLTYTFPISPHCITCKVFKSHTKSSWHNLISSLSPSTANSLNSDLRQLAPTPTVNFDYLLKTPRHGPRTENTVLLLLHACLLGFPRDRYPGSPLASWLLPSESLSMVPKRTPLLLFCVRLNVFTKSLPSNVYMQHTLIVYPEICSPLQL
jgi:hypothetical protein